MFPGDTPPVRFTSPSSTSASTKKYPGTPKSPMLNNSNINSSGNSNPNTGNRNSQARQRLLSSKISAPRPINLPSLRREHAVGIDVPASSPATSHGWGSASSSPSLSQQHTQPHTESDASEKKHDTEATHDKPSKPSDTSATSPVLIPATATSASSATPTRAWADDKEYLKYASSDPNHRSWDEMVSEDMDDFSVDVVEFDDGTKVQVGSDASSVDSHASASRTTEPVLPSERFTDDYDRSYPAKQPYHHHPPAQQHYHQHHDHDHANYKPYRRSEDHGYSSRYSQTNYSSRRHSSTVDGGNEKRTSGTSDRWTAAGLPTTASTRRESTDRQPHYGHRRPSYDRKHDNGPYHSTSLLQRPRRLSEQSFRSDHSREEVNSSNNPLHIIPGPSNATPENAEEIIVVQKNLMLTAAERAKKRLEEQEAEFKAAAERAKQKADALAAKAELKEKTILKKPSAVSVDTAPSKKTAASPSPTSAATNKTPVKASPPPPNVATATQASKAPLPPKLPDTSKPWNLVAANKQVPHTSSTTAAAASTSPAVATAPNQSEDQTKVHPLQTPKEPLSTSSRDNQPTQILKNEEKKPVAIMKKEPRNAAKEEKKEQVEEQDEGSTSKKPLTEDEKNWQKFVSTIKTDPQAVVRKDVTSTDWNMYADRLQETTAEQDAIATSTRQRLIREVEKEIALESQQHKQQQQPLAVEVFDYDNEDWGPAPTSSMIGRNMDRGAWTREDNAHNLQRGLRNGHRSSSARGGRGGGTSSINRDMGRTSNLANAKSRKTADYWQHDTTDEEQKEEKPIVVEILKKQEPVLLKKTQLTNLLKESSSPIFPGFIDKLAAKKPANMSFMVDIEESDKEITMMQQDTTLAAVEDETISVATTHTTTTENSPASTPPKSQFPMQQQQQHQRRMNVNRHFPVLVYQYPTAQSAPTTTTGTSDHPGSPSSSVDVGSKSPSSHHQQSPQNRPLGVYLMPQQPFLATNQYVVSYPQVGTSNVQPIYYPTLSWQQQKNTGMAPRAAFDHHHQPQHHRRPYNSNYNDYSAPNGYRQHKYPHNPSAYQNASSGRGNSYRKRGGGAAQSWSGSMVNNAGRGNGGHYQTPHNASYNRNYSRHGIDAAANEPPSPAVDIQQPSL
ncbi:hypothetical protein MAM1_0031d02392 [Mucor ambiguus]|uniref:Uncharacterized protein n=1 Tax=Mucor ambiguus TaxID=91626 RepID=A0A0C9MIM4_9FUNG|nr:hypothetical protein MAM1_0031d02392 [Mucor ambiguus]